MDLHFRVAVLACMSDAVCDICTSQPPSSQVLYEMLWGGSLCDALGGYTWSGGGDTYLGGTLIPSAPVTPGGMEVLERC